MRHIKTKLKARSSGSTGLRHYQFSRANLAIVTLVVAGIGGYFLLSSFAATNSIGDANNDGQVNVTDLSILLSNYGTSNTATDFNNDGTVNVIDLSIVLSHYGTVVSTASCNLYASPTGSDSNSGSSAAPYRTLQKLDTSLAAGQTGCLRAGTYGSISTEHVLSKSGTSGSRITIRNAPGEHAKVLGFIYISGSYLTLSHLDIDAANNFYPGGTTGSTQFCTFPSSEALSVSAIGIILEYNDIYQSSLKGNLIGVGFASPANNSIVRYNKLHDAGGCDDYDHIIYLAHGTNVQIYGNWLWNDSHGWGIQVYPGPSGSSIHGNVIDNTGSGFTISDEGQSITNNLMFNNVVLNSVGVSNPDIGWAGQPGYLVTAFQLAAGSTGNQVYQNVSYNNPGGISSIGSIPASRLSITNNITSNPLFVNAGSHNYQLQAGSPAAGYGLWDGTDPGY